MGYFSLLIIPFLWLACLPLGDGHGWHVLRVIRGHAQAFWISPGMDKDQVGRLLGEDWGPNCGLVYRFRQQRSRDGNVRADPVITEREYCPSEIGVIFEKKTGDTPRVTRVFSWPLLLIWWDVQYYVACDWLKGLPDPVAEFVEKAMSGWEQVIFDIPPE